MILSRENGSRYIVTKIYRGPNSMCAHKFVFFIVPVIEFLKILSHENGSHYIGTKIYRGPNSMCAHKFIFFTVPTRKTEMKINVCTFEWYGILDYCWINKNIL